MSTTHRWEALLPEDFQAERESPHPSQFKPDADEGIAKIAVANAVFGNRLLDAAAANLAEIAKRMLA